MKAAPLQRFRPSVLGRHRHPQPYAAVVLDGSFGQEGLGGAKRRRLGPAAGFPLVGRGVTRRLGHSIEERERGGKADASVRPSTDEKPLPETAQGLGRHVGLLSPRTCEWEGSNAKILQLLES